MIQKHIYLSGFMGVGKSTVGRLLAKKLLIPFMDTDELIAQKCRMTIERIFAERGEAFFRDQERSLLKNLRRIKPHCVSLGGGIILNAANREIFREGLWINLKATPATLMARLTGATGRPLLGGPFNREKIDTLLRQRRPYYDLAPIQIETDGLSPDAVAETILKKALQATQTYLS